MILQCLLQIFISIWRGKFYTVKKIRFEPATMNCEENKTKRAYYVSRLMEESGNGKTIVYIDETN